MYDLESINAEQIVTATDRLLCGYRLERRIARGTTDLTIAARRAVAQSAERTIYVRHRRPSQTLTLLGAAAAAAWLAVALVCLLV